MLEDKFKIRAYCIPEHCYVKITQLNFDTKGNISEMKFLKPKSIDPDFKYVCLKEQLDEFVFEQCTGCKDCGGNLIYEGDILEIMEDTGVSHAFVYMNEEFQKWSIDGDTESDYDFYELVNRPCDNKSEIDDISIVGNIHINSNLLNKK